MKSFLRASLRVTSPSPGHSSPMLFQCVPYKHDACSSNHLTACSLGANLPLQFRGENTLKLCRIGIFTSSQKGNAHASRLCLWHRLVASLRTCNAFGLRPLSFGPSLATLRPLGLSFGDCFTAWAFGPGTASEKGKKSLDGLKSVLRASLLAGFPGPCFGLAFFGPFLDFYGLQIAQR